MPVYKKEPVFSALTINNTLPANMAGDDLHLFRDDLTKTFPGVSLNFINHVSVTPHGILFNGFNIFDQFLIWNKHKQEFNFWYLLRNFFGRKKLEADPHKKYLICFDYWSMGYFHWMCDFLPRIMAAEDYLNKYTLVLPYNHSHSFVNESLKIFPVKEIIQFSDKEYMSFKEVLIPDYICPSGDNNPKVMNALKQKFINFYKPAFNTSKYYENIYISRSKAKGRYIENEAELIQALEGLGYKTIHFEEHSLEEQILIAYNSKNMIGLHGANLTNLMFMNPGTNILELRKENDRENNYYFSLASSFHLNYFYLQCTATDTTNPQTFNLKVDVASLLILAEKMLSSEHKTYEH